VRVAFDLHLLTHLDRPGLGDPADIITAEVDQHQVLGAFLLVGQQLGLEGGIFGLVGTARPGAGDRPHRHLAVLEPGQDLR